MREDRLNSPAHRRTRGWIAGAWCVGIVLLAALAGVFEATLGVSSIEIDLSRRFEGAHWPHLLGTDEVGRDVWTRLLFGARVSLSVALGSTLLSTTIGVIIGLHAGYRGGWVDAAWMRVIELLSTLPALPLLVMLAAIPLENWPVVMQTSEMRLIWLIGMFAWMPIARLTRGVTRQLRQRPFVTAAEGLGLPGAVVAWRHVLPNAVGPILVAATLDVGSHLLYEASLSFLGLGVQAPTPSWGNLLAQSVDHIRSQPTLALWPGLAISLTVSCCYLLGDALRDWLDPHRRTRRLAHEASETRP